MQERLRPVPAITSYMELLYYCDFSVYLYS